MTTAFLKRRALILAAPALLLPRTALGKLVATPAGTEGPFYPVRRPSDDNADLFNVDGAGKEARGDLLHLAGRVLDLNAKPVAQVRVEIWQCDANGVYLHPRDPRRAARDPAFQGFGHALTDIAGNFAFRTIVPVPYPGRTPHIHVKILRDGRPLLTSQLYRQGHPQNADDFLFDRLGTEERQRVSMALTPRKGPARQEYDTAIDLVIGG